MNPKKFLLKAAVPTAFMIWMAGYYALSHLSYSFKEPRAISRQFIDLVQTGDLSEAYLLTDRGSLVGRTPEAFAIKLRQQLGVEKFPTHRPVEWRGSRGGRQSYGNRIRRWIMRRKINPDQISIDYYVGLPFEVCLRSDKKGKWLIYYFQSHAL